MYTKKNFTRMIYHNIYISFLVYPDSHFVKKFSDPKNKKHIRRTFLKSRNTIIFGFRRKKQNKFVILSLSTEN